MPYTLNDKIRSLVPYDPISGDYRIRLDANESYLSLPEDLLQQALPDALNTELNRYPDPFAAALCESFARFYRINARHVTAGNGSDELISIITGAFFTPEDELVTLAHDFSMYRFYGELSGVKTSIYPKREDMTVDVDGLINYINLSGARGLIFSNPCNPTSLCMDRRQVEKILRSVKDCLVIVDEAYMDFADESILKDANRYDNLIVLKTSSKAVGLAGIRLGFAVASTRLTDALRAAKSPYNVNTLTQCVGREVYAREEYLINCTEKLIHARDQLYNGILLLHARHSLFDMVYPTATNFVFIRTRYARPIYDRLLERSIAIRFMGDFLRITAGSKRENETLIRTLDEILNELE